MTPVVAAHPPHGHAIWSSALGTGQDQVAVVAAYAGTDPGNDAARGRQASLIAQDVAEQLGATFAGRAENVRRSTVGDIRLLDDRRVVGRPPPLARRRLRPVGRHMRYVVQCEALGAESMDFSRGCARIMSTFRPTEPLLGAGSPLEAAQGLYRSAKAGRADIAHRVATDDAAKELPVWDSRIEPPTTCFVSGGASGQLCGAKKPRLFSIEFEVGEFGGRWVVTHVFHCTLYGSERFCWTFGP